MSIEDNVARVRERMRRAAEAAGRKDEALLVAATKTRTAEEVRRVIAAGVDACGENRIQEMTQKLSLNAYIDTPLHFIGTIQRNKVKYAVGTAALIESVNSPELLEDISRLAVKQGVIQDVLLEINIGSESTKSGAAEDMLIPLIEKAETLKGVKIRGLMAIPPAAAETGSSRPFFAAMYKLFVDTKGKRYDNTTMEILSMGMSDDFEDAIMEGATAVRVGTALFGPRNNPTSVR